MWTYTSGPNPVEPKLKVGFDSDKLSKDAVDILKASVINIQTEKDGMTQLIDVMLNNVSQDAIERYVDSRPKEEFNEYKLMVAAKDSKNSSVIAFLLKYGRIVIQVRTKEIEVREEIGIGEMIKAYNTNNRYPKKVYAKDVIDLFKGIAAPYAQTVHKSQGSTFESVISDNSTNDYQSTVNKLETLYVAYSRSKGDIVIAPNILSNLDKYTSNEAELAIDEYLSTDLTPEASTKYENSIIQNNEPKTKHTEVRDDIKKCLLKIGSK